MICGFGYPAIRDALKQLPIRISEIALLVGLFLLLCSIRVYYGGSHGLMFVWKGELSFTDTLVDLSKVESMPKEELVRKHPSVYWQLLAMDIVQDNDDIQVIRKRREVRHIQPRAEMERPQ